MIYKTYEIKEENNNTGIKQFKFFNNPDKKNACHAT